MRAGMRGHPLWIAYLVHRLSGLALGLFLPVHFWVLSAALRDPAAFEGFFRFAEMPAVKVAEFGLVFLLAVHMFGGLRLLALEWLPWSAPQKTLAAASAAFSFLVAGIFFLGAI